MSMEKAAIWLGVVKLALEITEGCLRLKDRRSKLTALEKRVAELESRIPCPVCKAASEQPL